MIQTSICAAVKGLPRGAVPSHGSGRVGGSNHGATPKAGWFISWKIRK